MEEVNIKYNRQIAWITEEGQRKLEDTYVAVVGVSGTGSHVIQQLAYLGVKKFLLIDSDEVHPTNLNRLIGANEKDLDKPKTEIGERLIKFINTNTEVKTIPDTFVGSEGISALKEVDFVFGCMDKDGARLVLTEFCKAYKKPYLDIATGIPDGYWGGRILFSDELEGCLLCLGELDQQEIRRDLSTAEDRSLQDKIYGIEVAELAGTGPSVISLNGILSSLAVTEFLVHIAKIRLIKRYFKYNGKTNTITKPNDPISPNCYYCNSIAGIGDKADMERYQRQGTDKILR